MRTVRSSSRLLHSLSYPKTTFPQSRSFPDQAQAGWPRPALSSMRAPPATRQTARGWRTQRGGAAPSTLRRPHSWLFTLSSAPSCSRGCSRSAGLAVLARRGPCGVAGHCPGAKLYVVQRMRRRDPAHQTGAGARAGRGRAPGRCERAASPRTSRPVGWSPCGRSGCAPCSFRPGPRPPPPSSPPRQRCLRAPGRAPGSRRGKRGRDRGADVGEPEGAAPGSSMAARGAATSAGGRPPLPGGAGPSRAVPRTRAAAGLGEPPRPGTASPLASCAGARAPCAWPGAAGRRRSDAPGCALASVPAQAAHRRPRILGYSLSQLERLGEPSFPTGDNDYSRRVLPLESYPDTFDHPSRVRRKNKE